MPDENDKKPIHDDLEDALREFEKSGGFTSKPSQDQQSSSNQGSAKKNTSSSMEDDDDFTDLFADIDDEFKQDNKNTDRDNQFDEDTNLYDDSDNAEYEVNDDENTFEDISEENINNTNNNTQGIGKRNGGVNTKGGVKNVIEKFKNPKNAIILVVAIGFVLFVILQSGNKKDKVQYKPINGVQQEEEVVGEVSDSKKNQGVEDVNRNTTGNAPNLQLSDIQLPNLDIKLPEVNSSDIDLIPRIPKVPESNIPDPEVQDKPKDDNNKNEDDIKIPESPKVDIPKEGTAKTKKDELPDINTAAEQAEQAKEVRVSGKRPIPTKAEELKPLVIDFTGGADIPNQTSKTRQTNDFIFLGTDMDLEVTADEVSAQRIKSPENVVAQGRMIDAILETAVNSTVGGTVRAVVARDVYAEVGKNILIPKGTRLYGEYGGQDGASSTKGARIIITWTRIVRPDNVSAAIKSFASDQFGRSGVEGDVDQKYFSSITSSILLSTIPLVTTIVTNAITNQNPQTTTIGSGNTTVVQDPINIATQSFTNQISKMTADVIKDMVNTKPTITLNQGTRVKVLINQDIRLPAYEPITKSVSGISN